MPLTWFYFRLEEEASSDENDSDDGSDDNSGSEDASSSSSESSSSSGYAMYYFSNANQCYYVYFCKVQHRLIRLRECFTSKSLVIFVCQSSDQDPIFLGQAYTEIKNKSKRKFFIYILCKKKNTLENEKYIIQIGKSEEYVTQKFQIFFSKMLSLPFMIYTLITEGPNH